MTGENMHWVNKEALEPKELLLIGKVLQGMTMSSQQITDFLERYMHVPAKGKELALKAKLSRSKSLYNQEMTAFEKHEAESRAFRIIEERTGLSHSDIEQLYQLQSDEHKKYARRWFERIDWNQDVRIVLAGILHFCCDGDRANAERATLFWLGDEHIGKYGYKGDIINLLKQRYPDFAITLKSPDSIPYKRFEQLLQSTERTRQWTVESIRKEFHRKPDWGSEDNKILWSGLRQYCGMTEYGAMKFLSDRYGWKIKNTHKRPNQATGRTMKNQGNSINDFAPIGTADEPKARAQFEALLALQTSPAGTPWSIARVIEARKRGDFKK